MGLNRTNFPVSIFGGHGKPRPGQFGCSGWPRLATGGKVVKFRYIIAPGALGSAVHMAWTFRSLPSLLVPYRILGRTVVLVVEQKMPPNVIRIGSDLDAFCIFFEPGPSGGVLGSGLVGKRWKIFVLVSLLECHSEYPVTFRVPL